MAKLCDSLCTGMKIIEAMNDQLRVWESSDHLSMEEWLLGEEKRAVKLIGYFKEKVEVARNKLSKRF